MADPFTSSKAPTIAAGVDPYLTTPRTETGPTTRPNRAQLDAGGGFSSGMLVAAVFVVVAILAALVYSNRDYFSPAADNSDVNIENTVAPAPATAMPEPASQPEAIPAADPPIQPEADPVVPAPQATTPTPVPEATTPAPEAATPAPAPQPAAPASP